MNALLMVAVIAAVDPTPFLDTSRMTRRQIEDLDEVIYADGRRGEAYVREIARTGDTYTVACVVGKRRVLIPIARLRAILFCDGARLEKSDGATTPLASNKQNERISCVAVRLWRQHRQFMIDYESSGQVMRNHLHRFLNVSLGGGFIVHSGSDMLVEGWGWKRAHLGARKDDIIRAFGKPGYSKYPDLLDYEKTHGFICAVLEDGTIRRLYFNPAFRGRLLRSGYGIGSPMESILAWYGQPVARTRVASRDLVKRGVPDTLFIYSGGARIWYPKHGVCFWFANGKLLQVIMDLQDGREYYAGGQAPQPQPQVSAFNGHRYKVVLSAVSWHEARDACIKAGGHLLTINSAEEERYVRSICPDNWRMWLGMTDEGHEGRWTWVTNEPMTYTDWARGEPNNAAGLEHFGNIDTNTVGWNDLAATSSLRIGYVCEWDNVTQAQPDAVVVSNGHRYGVFLKHITWQKARDACAAAGGHLVAIETLGEAAFISDLVRRYPEWDRFWLGMSDAEDEGQWRWVNGQPVTVNRWAPGEPNNGGHIQHCGAVAVATGLWDDVQHNWGAPIGYICEWSTAE